MSQQSCGSASYGDSLSGVFSSNNVSGNRLRRPTNAFTCPAIPSRNVRQPSSWISTGDLSGPVPRTSQNTKPPIASTVVAVATRTQRRWRARFAPGGDAGLRATAAAGAAAVPEAGGGGNGGVVTGKSVPEPAAPRSRKRARAGSLPPWPRSAPST